MHNRTPNDTIIMDDEIYVHGNSLIKAIDDIASDELPVDEKWTQGIRYSKRIIRIMMGVAIRMRKMTKENIELIKGIVDDIQWVQEYVQAVGEEHKQVYVDALENAMKQLMTIVKTAELKGQ